MKVLSKKRDCIVVVGAGKNQLPLILAAKAKGFMVIAIDRNKTSIGFLYVDIKIIESTHNTKAVLLRLSELEGNYGISGVICRSTGSPLYTATFIAKKYLVPGLCEELLPLVTEKSKLREFCKKKNILMPRGYSVSQCGENAEYSYPLIVKPDFTVVGKQAIRVVNSVEELNMAVCNAIASSGNGVAEIEEYISGFDISCIVHIKDQKAQIIFFFDELVGITKGKNIIGLGVSVPSVVMGTSIETKVVSIINDFSANFSNVNGIVSFSFRIDELGKPFLIELHADLGGDLIADVLLPEACESFDFFDYCTEVAIGNKNKIAAISLKNTVILYGNEYLSSVNQLQNKKNDQVLVLKNDSLEQLHVNITDCFVKNMFYDKTITYHCDFLKRN